MLQNLGVYCIYPSETPANGWYPSGIDRILFLATTYKPRKLTLKKILSKLKKRKKIPALKLDLNKRIPPPAIKASQIRLILIYCYHVGVCITVTNIDHIKMYTFMFN